MMRIGAEFRDIPQSSVLRVTSNDRIAQAEASTVRTAADTKLIRAILIAEREIIAYRSQARQGSPIESFPVSLPFNERVYGSIPRHKLIPLKCYSSGSRRIFLTPLWLFVEERIPRAETEARSFRFAACELYGL